MVKNRLNVTAFVITVLLWGGAAGAAPLAVPYNGYLTDAEGEAYDGNVSVTAELYETFEGGEQHRAGTRPAPTTLGDVIGAFKSLTTVEYGRHVRSDRWPPFERRLWQRNYYEHIIRDEASLHRIRTYMKVNPSRWEFDRENPARRTATDVEPR